MRPFITINMAMSADGKIATANRKLCSFGSPRDQAFLYELRARADAVMTGAGTIRAQNADLNSGGPQYQRLRLRRGLQREPARVVVSASGNLDTSLRIFHEPGGPLFILTRQGIPDTRRKRLEAAGAVVKSFGDSDLDLRAALRWLRRQGIATLHCEGGGELNQSLFEIGCVDELFLTLCPRVFGGRSAPTLAEGQGVLRLANALKLKWLAVRQIGDELFLHFRRTEDHSKTRSTKANSARGSVHEPRVGSSKRRR